MVGSTKIGSNFVLQFWAKTPFVLTSNFYLYTNLKSLKILRIYYPVFLACFIELKEFVTTKFSIFWSNQFYFFIFVSWIDFTKYFCYINCNNDVSYQIILVLKRSPIFKMINYKLTTIKTCVYITWQQLINCSYFCSNWH
jgi:hypothetical protein